MTRKEDQEVEIEKLKLTLEDRKDRREWWLRMVQLVLSFVLGVGVGGGSGVLLSQHVEELLPTTSAIEAAVVPPAEPLPLPEDPAGEDTGEAMPEPL